jgi:hypothetical protein
MFDLRRREFLTLLGGAAARRRGRWWRAREASTMRDVTLAVKLARFFLRGLQ